MISNNLPNADRVAARARHRRDTERELAIWRARDVYRLQNLGLGVGVILLLAFLSILGALVASLVS